MNERFVIAYCNKPQYKGLDEYFVEAGKTTSDIGEAKQFATQEAAESIASEHSQLDDAHKRAQIMSIVCALEHWNSRFKSEANNRGFIGDYSSISIAYDISTEKWRRVIDVYWNHGSQPDDMQGAFQGDIFKTQGEALTSIDDKLLTSFLDEVEKRFSLNKQGA